jgi:DNA polymerase-3 subunit epsilon
MAFEWLTGGSLPQFWKNYVALFDNENEGLKRYVVFDMETTGLDFREDVVLSIGAIGVAGNAIEVGDFLVVEIKQDKFTSQSVAMSGLVKEEAEKVVEAEGMIQFLNFIKDATLVGHNVNLDIEMVNQLMDTNVLYNKWKGFADDSQAPLDELCDALKIDKSDRHTAWGNAFTTALVFLKLKRKLRIA